MTHLMIREADLDQLRKDIAAEVAESLRPLFDNRSAKLVDGDVLANAIGVSRATVDRLRANETIPSVKIGAKRLYDINDVLEALK